MKVIHFHYKSKRVVKVGNIDYVFQKFSFDCQAELLRDVTNRYGVRYLIVRPLKWDNVWYFVDGYGVSKTWYYGRLSRLGFPHDDDKPSDELCLKFSNVTFA